MDWTEGKNGHGTSTTGQPENGSVGLSVVISQNPGDHAHTHPHFRAGIR